MCYTTLLYHVCLSTVSTFFYFFSLLSLSLLSPPTSIYYVRRSLLQRINNQLYLSLECKLITWSGFPSPESWANLPQEWKRNNLLHASSICIAQCTLPNSGLLHCSSQSVLGSTVLPCVTPNINSPACHTPTTPSTSTITIQHGEDQVSHLNICVLWVL